MGGIAVALALLIKTFLLQAFYIPSGSMEQTLLIKDRVLVNKLVYKFRSIHRGEIVVFAGKDERWQDPEVLVDEPQSGLGKVLNRVQKTLGLGAPGDKDYIKRVIGIPGDIVACCTNGRITVNGQEVDESEYLYLDDPDQQQTEFGPETIPPGKLWVLGDHRDKSGDSRMRGVISTEHVIGRAFVVLWPPRHAKPLRVPAVWDPKPSSLPARPAGPWSLAMTPPALGIAASLPLTITRWWRRRRRGLVTA